MNTHSSKQPADNFPFQKSSASRHPATSLPHRKKFCGKPSKRRLLFLITPLCLAAMNAEAASVRINELHYDNIGADSQEGVELVGLSSVDLEGWSLVFYNGNNGDPYKTEALSGQFSSADTESLGVGFLQFEISGLQNGPADALALIDNNDVVMSFLSYEGSVQATSGPAEGMQSIDIAASESGTNEPGTSLQRIGDIIFSDTGISFSNSNWVLETATWQSLNNGQALLMGGSEVPLPSALLLFFGAITGLAGCSLGQRRDD